jgi:hypothetical protein
LASPLQDEPEMLALGLLIFLVAAALVVVAFVALLTVPSYLAVRRVMRRRFVAPLQRGKLERVLVLGASIAGACSSVVHANAIGAALSRATHDEIGIAQCLLLFVVPLPLAVVPWAAGELLGGESETPGLGLLCCVGTTFALAFAAFLALGVIGVEIPTIETQIATTSVAALGGAAMYLAMRGSAIDSAPPEAIAIVRVLSDYSSSMSENLSLRGDSSGFF